MWKPTIRPNWLNKFICALLLIGSSINLQAEEWQYTVKQGDNLWDIAESFLIDMRYWRKLQQLNRVTEPRSLPPGTVLNIPISWSIVKPATALVTQVSGETRVIAAGETTRTVVDLGQRLKVGDKVITPQGANVTLKFPDSSSLTLRENSELVIEKLETYGDEDGFNTQLNLQRGRSETHANPEKKNSTRFEIHTPSATAAVRGTVYRVSAEDAEVTTSEVIEGKVEVANTLGATDVPAGFGTRVEKDSPPTEPVELLPAVSLADLPTVFERLPIRHTLDKSTGASGFRIHVAEQADFQELLANTTSSTGIGISDLPDGDYQLRVRGIDDQGLEGEDSLGKFRVNVRPEPPLAISPNLNAVMPPEFNTFEWTLSNAVSHYHLEVADNPEFTAPVINEQSLKEARYELPTPLTAGQWYWRLTAISADEGAGPKGDAMPFKIMNAGPEMSEPMMDETSLNLQWSASQADDQYQIQIARDVEFTDIVTDETVSEPSYSQALPEPGSSIFVRTKILASDGLEGSWSAPQKVDIPAEPPYWLMTFLPLLLML